MQPVSYCGSSLLFTSENSFKITVHDLKDLFDGECVVEEGRVLTLDVVQMIDVRGSLIRLKYQANSTFHSQLFHLEPDELLVANYPRPGLDGMSERPMVHLPLSKMEEWAPKVATIFSNASTLDDSSN
jgi:hypothetical protein